MSKDFEGKGFTNDLSTLEVQPKSVETFGILCELSKTCKYFTKSLQNEYILKENASVYWNVQCLLNICHGTALLAS